MSRSLFHLCFCFSFTKQGLLLLCFFICANHGVSICLWCQPWCFFIYVNDDDYDTDGSADVRWWNGGGERCCWFDKGGRESIWRKEIKKSFGVEDKFRDFDFRDDEFLKGMICKWMKRRDKWIFIILDFDLQHRFFFIFNSKHFIFLIVFYHLFDLNTFFE